MRLEGPPCRGGGGGRPCSPLSLGPLLTPDLWSPCEPLSAGAKSLALLGPPVPTVASPSSRRREGCRPDACPSVWEGGVAPTFQRLTTWLGFSCHHRVLTASSLSSHQKTWFPMTRTCTSAKRMNTTPISAAMERATAVSPRPPAPHAPHAPACGH